MASLLDTDVLSQSVKERPNEKVLWWLENVTPENTFFSVVTILELRTGIELMTAGRRQTMLEAWLEDDIRKNYAGRIPA